jgi:hypothetical protein
MTDTLKTLEEARFSRTYKPTANNPRGLTVLAITIPTSDSSLPELDITGPEALDHVARFVFEHALEKLGHGAKSAHDRVAAASAASPAQKAEVKS